MSDERADGAVTLVAARPVLDVYYRALSGRPAHLLGRGGDDDPAQAPDTATTIRLPNRVGRFDDSRANFDWLKVALTHRAAHHECGTFDFHLDRPARLQPRVTDGVAEMASMEPETDLEKVLRAFTYRSLAVELFTVAEDLRVDAALPRLFPGTARALARVQEAELAGRPTPGGLAPRTALLELFVQLSLGRRTLPALPPPLHQPARQILAVAGLLREPWATVEDAVEAAARVYALVTRQAPLGSGKDDAVTVAASGAEDAPLPDSGLRLPEPDPVRLEGDPVLEASVSPVDYRDVLGWRYSRYETPGPPGQQAIFRLRSLPGSDDGQAGEPDPEAGHDDRPTGPPEPLPHEHHEWFVDHYAQAQGALTADAPGEHLYPEWDHVQERYRPRWCRVRERALPPGTSSRLYEETLRVYRDVLPGMVRGFERLAHEGLRAVGRQPDGDDLDLDASIEALTDLRAGVVAGDRVHQRLERVARDVAVAFLLDLSASTAERVDPVASDRRRYERIHGRPYRRIIDVERESVALLLAALQRTRDAVGVYGFSGTGRGDVRFDVVKDLHEPMSRRVASRLENLDPVHTTRMGPAIRHTVSKLHAGRASTKVLVLVSDGRPYDRDYGQEYGEGAELEYAVQDTRRALVEAGEHRIATMVLTAGNEGHDYLSQLGDDLHTESLSDVTRLPLHLLSLYRRARGRTDRASRTR